MPPRRLLLAKILMLLSLALVWQGCEAAGGEAGYSPEECSDACARVAAADCGDVGSSCFDSCVSNPNAQHQGDCPLELQAYFDCWWQAGAYECDADERTQAVGCDMERSTYLTCSGDTGAGGASGASGASDGGAGGSAGAPNAAGAAVGGATETEAAAGADTGGVAGAGG